MPQNKEREVKVMLKRIHSASEYKVLKAIYKNIRVINVSDSEVLVHVSK